MYTTSTSTVPEYFYTTSTFDNYRVSDPTVASNSTNTVSNSTNTVSNSTAHDPVDYIPHPTASDSTVHDPVDYIPDPMSKLEHQLQSHSNGNLREEFNAFHLFTTTYMTPEEFEDTFDVHPNDGEGNCLFFALATLLHMDFMDLRTLLFNYYANPANADIANLNNEEVDMNHNANILLPTTWGNATDIYVLSLLLHIDIRLFYYNTQLQKYIVITSNYSDTVKRIICIRLKNLHYEALFIKSNHNLIPRKW